MATIDPEKERQRLAEFYAYQMDGELEKGRRSGADHLTDMARDALRSETGTPRAAPRQWRRMLL